MYERRNRKQLWDTTVYKMVRKLKMLKSPIKNRREMIMENIKPLIMSQVVSVEKSNNNLTVDIKDLKKERNIHPKELSPASMARSGINKMSMLFENRGREHIFSVREVEFNISQEKIKYSGKAYSVYFEFNGCGM
ncbi:hypothetical protein IPdc08_01543 [archaeon]|nr:hypothetical protein IPdc08_01543 [archaeon]